jgi:amino acid transporter
VHEQQRDAGLVRAVGPWALAASIVNVVVGGAIFAAPSGLASSVGAYAPLVFLACAVAIGSVAICFAEGGSRVPTSGGPYGYIEAALGPFAGYLAGTMLCLSDALACGGIAAALADTVVTPLPSPTRGAVRAAVIVVVVGSVALVNAAGVARGARLINVATALKLVPLFVFVCLGATAVRAANLADAPAPTTAGLGQALILALFAFMGMETSLCASGEVREPSRTIPRAIGISMVSVTLLFVAIQIVAQGLLGASLATSSAPLADALGKLHPAMRVFMLAGAAMSMFGWIGSDLLGTPRMVFALARDGWLPRAFASVHPRSHAPSVAILSYAAVAITLALTGTFAELAELSALAIAPLYVGGCAAAWLLARRGVARADAPLGFRWLGAAALTGIGSMIAMVGLAKRAEILGLGALVVILSTLYVPLSRRLQRAVEGHWGSEEDMTDKVSGGRGGRR